MKIFGIAGWSGSGKTLLIEALLPALIGHGLTVSTIKHTHHSLDLDSPGKDTFRHRSAGATDVGIVSESRWTLMHELRGEAEASPDVLLARMTPVDLVLVEGFKTLGHDKLEVHRPSQGYPLLSPSDASVVAVASDVPLSGLAVPRFDLDDIGGIAAFVVRHCGFAAP